jgi:hypothetical protein
VNGVEPTPTGLAIVRIDALKGVPWLAKLILGLPRAFEETETLVTPTGIAADADSEDTKLTCAVDTALAIGAGGTYAFVVTDWDGTETEDVPSTLVAETVNV